MVEPSQQLTEALSAAVDTAREQVVATLAIAAASGSDTSREAFSSSLLATHTFLATLVAPSRHSAVAALWPAYHDLIGSLASASGARPPWPAPTLDELRLRVFVVGWLARHVAQTRPAALLGALYAVAALLTTLEASGEVEARQRNAQAWEMFEARMRAAPLTQIEQLQAVSIAEEVAGDLAGLIAALQAGGQRPLRQLVRVLNPAAGKHPIPDSLEAIEAAVVAGDRSWTAHPYYPLRYIRRGVRFTWSDSAWLVTLCDAPQEEVMRQVLWLGQLLATRGMPRWLLEDHLELLYDELARALPAQSARYAPLLRAADLLKAERLARLDEAASDELCATFATLVGPKLVDLVPEAAMLVVAAVADERAHIPGAITSLVSWLANPILFPPRWVEAIQKVLMLAQQRSTR